jgi:hypothetical protein
VRLHDKKGCLRSSDETQIVDSLLKKAVGKTSSKIYFDQEITGMKPQSKLWKQIRKLAAGY